MRKFRLPSLRSLQWLPQRRKPWLGRIDRYIIYKFLSTYIFLITIIVVIAVIFDFNEKIDKIQNAFSTATSAIQEYNEKGYLSIDNLQSLLALDDK